MLPRRAPGTAATAFRALLPEVPRHSVPIPMVSGHRTPPHSRNACVAMSPAMLTQLLLPSVMSGEGGRATGTLHTQEGTGPVTPWSTASLFLFLSLKMR